MGCSVCRFFQPLLSACYFGTWRRVPPLQLGAGGVFCAFFSFVWAPLHYIHMMFFTVIFCVITALAVSRVVFGTSPAFEPAVKLG